MKNLTSHILQRNLLLFWIAGLICFFEINSAIAVFGQQRQTLSPEDAKLWREDLRFLADELPKRHKNLFHTMTREQFETAVKRLDERIPTLQRHQVIIEMGRIFAMVGDGHTRLNLLYNYSEAGQFELPNSRLPASVSTHYWQGEFPWDTRQWIAPHYAAELTSEDYRNKQDPALKLILDYKPKPWTIDLRTPFADEVTEVLDKQGFEAAKKRYYELKNDPLHTYADLYWVLRLTGRRMQNRQRYDEAIKIFELNISEHPRSDEAQVLMGDVYWISQRKEQAIKHYERAVELNPSNWRIADPLRNWRRDHKQSLRRQ